MTSFFELMSTMFTSAKASADIVGFRGPYIGDRFREVLPVVDLPDLVYEWPSVGRLSDWCPSTAPYRLFSRRMAEVVRSGLGPRDRVEWVTVTVRTLDGVEHPYEVPHFLEYPDVLDEEVTDWGPSGLPIRWVLSREKIEGLNFFAPGFVSMSVIVTGTLLREMKAVGLTGMEVQRARVYDGSGGVCPV